MRTKFSKLLSILLCLVMALTLLPTVALAAGSGYQDTDGHWAETAIDRWSAYGVLEGDSGNFNPDGALTRAQMAAILSRLLNLPDAPDAGFSDVKPDDWFAEYINKCAAAGIMLGDNGKANPNEPITRQQAIVMIARALGIQPIENPDLTKYADAAQVSAYAQGYVAALIEAGIVGGVTADLLAPQANINRASTVTILDRAIGTYANEAGETIKADGDGLILIVAKDVKLTDVPEGTRIVVADGATGLTVNGKAVSDDQTYIVPETTTDTPSGGSSSSGGSSHTHSYTTEKVTKEPTCTEAGVKTLTCSCGATKTEEIPAKGHSFVYADNGDGTHIGTCSSCGVTSDAAAHDTAGTDGACSVCGANPGDHTVSLKHGNTVSYYNDFTTAVSEAQAGDTVTLLTNVNCEGSDSVEFAKNLTLNLNKKSLTGFKLQVKGANLKLTGNGTVSYNSDSPVCIYSGTLTLAGTTISSNASDAVLIINSDSATTAEIVIADGTENEIATTGSGCDGIFVYANKNISLNITGEAEKTGKLTLSGVNAAYHGYPAGGKVSAHISGFAITANGNVDPGYGCTLEISDITGSFDTNVSDYCAAGYCTAPDGNGRYVYGMISVESAVCRIIHEDETSTYLMSLEQAMMQVADNETIQLLQDVSINSQTSDGISAENVIFDLNQKTITAKGTWLIAKHAGSYSYSPINATIKNGTYILNGTSSGRIRFEKGSTGIFKNVTFKSSNNTFYQAIQTYATNQTNAEETNTYCFEDCTFTNCYAGFEGSSGSCNNYDISFTGCEFTAANMSNGAACIAIDDYDYGQLTVSNTTFDIKNTNNGGYCVYIDTYLDYTNGQKFNMTLDNVTMKTSGNAMPYGYRFLYYNSGCSDNAVIQETGLNTYKHNDKPYELAIKEVTPTNKSVVWVENKAAFQAAYTEWKTYATEKPESYNSNSYYLVECDGFYFIGGQGTQFMISGYEVTKTESVVTQVKVSLGYTMTYTNVGTVDISTELGENDNTQVHIYTLA